MSSTTVNVSSRTWLSKLITESATHLENERTVTLIAINNNISSAISLAEMLKHKVAGLHQENSFDRLPDSNKTRVTLKLSLDPLDSASPGYQAPLPVDQVQNISLAELKAPPPPRENDAPRRGRGNNNRRGGRRGARGGHPGEERKQSQRQESRNPQNSSRRESNPRDEYVIKRPEPAPRGPNDILISFRRNPMAFIKEGLVKLKEGETQVVLKGSGQTIPKVVRVAEEIKNKEPGLHQKNDYSQRTIVQEFVSKVEGKPNITKERTVPSLEITLSKEPLDPGHYGYQEPLSVEKVSNISLEEAKNL